MEGSTLDLAFYEVGNAIWRQVHINKTLTIEEGNTVLDSLIEVIGRLKKTEVEKPLDILKIAVEEGLLFTMHHTSKYPWRTT